MAGNGIISGLLRLAHCVVGATPGIDEYQEIKRKSPRHDILLVRYGDTYYAYDDDAKKAEDLAVPTFRHKGALVAYVEAKDLKKFLKTAARSGVKAAVVKGDLQPY